MTKFMNENLRFVFSRVTLSTFDDKVQCRTVLEASEDIACPC